MKKLFKLSHNPPIHSLRLIDINDNKECWFQCLHSYSIFYKTSMQIINSPLILDRTFPKDACIIGVLCGETYKEFLHKKELLNMNSTFTTLTAHIELFRLVYISRNGLVVYEDSNKKSYMENILELAQNKKVIQSFSPQDAYYIGFLAGVELFKIKNNLMHKQTHLKLIYSRPKGCKEQSFNLNGL